MRASARILGQPLGLTAQEINYALKKRAFCLESRAYSVTEKGAKYATEQPMARYRWIPHVQPVVDDHDLDDSWLPR